MQNYNDLLRKVYETGTSREGRNGHTKALFAQQLRFDLRTGFPAVTTKKLAFKSVKAELLWFLSMRDRADDKELKALMGSDRTIWTDNAESDYWKNKAQFEGDLGRIYGVLWRSWGGKIDQIGNLVQKLKTDPFDRRLVVSAWNPTDLNDCALPACHMIWQCFVNADRELSCHALMRSTDLFLGAPFNIASYALLTHMLAQVTDLKVGELVMSFNDAHIYADHFEAVETQLSRQTLELPQLYLNPEITSIDSFKMDDIRLETYKSHPAIKAKMAV